MERFLYCKNRTGDESMFKASESTFTLKIPPWPDFLSGSYRYFQIDEKHVTRLCKYYVLLFILENTLYFTEDGKEVEVTAGEWYIQRPGFMQEGKKGSPTPVYYYIHFEACESSCDSIENSATDEPIAHSLSAKHFTLPVRGAYDLQIFKPFFNQLDYLSKRRPTDILGVQVSFLSLLNQLASSIHVTSTKSQKLVGDLMDFLAANFSKPLTSKQLSQQFHFTSDYLTRKMKQFCGLTPGQYIQQLRVDKAKELLSNTDQTLSYISEEIGYHDVSVFYKAFYKHTGIAPGTWRLINRGLNR